MVVLVLPTCRNCGRLYPGGTYCSEACRTEADINSQRGSGERGYDVSKCIYCQKTRVNPTTYGRSEADGRWRQCPDCKLGEHKYKFVTKAEHDMFLRDARQSGML